MLTVLLSRRWLAALAAAVVFAISCFFLGRWQWHRYEVKHARAERITSHYSAPPVPLQSVLPSTDTPMPLAKEWTRVTVTGRYDDAGRLLVRNRPNNSVYGYEVLVPLVLSGGASGTSDATNGVTRGTTAGATLLVDRGWVPNARTAEQDPQVPPAPQDPVTVTGWLRLGEPDVHASPKGGQLSSIDLAQAAKYTGRRLYRAYAVLGNERTADGRTPVRPTPLERPETDTGEGINLSYAFQWWFGCLAGFGLVFLGVRRETLDQAYAQSLGHGEPGSADAATAGEGAATPAAAGAVGTASLSGTASGPGHEVAAGGSGPADKGRRGPVGGVLAPTRPRKHRIWDDEDE